MNSILYNDRITEDNYSDFVEQIVNIFRLSSPDKYIMFSLQLDRQDCIIQLSILNNDGNKQEYEPIKMNNNSDYFYEFLDRLVSRLRDTCEIMTEDMVNLDDDHYVAFRMITKFNDLITIDGLTEGQANHLLGNGEEDVENDSSLINNKGGSSLLGVLLLITLVLISLVAVLLLVN